MLPIDIIRLAERRRRDGERIKLPILVSTEDWEALRDYLEQLEPITQWPRPEREPVTRLEVHGIAVLARAAINT